MRIIVLAGLAVGAIAVFAPEQGAGLMRSGVHGFGWELGARSRTTFLAIAIGDGDRGVAGTVEEDGRADLQQRIGNGKDPPGAGIG